MNERYEIRITSPDDVIVFSDELEAHQRANNVNKQYVADCLKRHDPNDHVLCVATVHEVDDDAAWNASTLPTRDVGAAAEYCGDISQRKADAYARPAAVPDGFALVPVEPTPEMVMAGHRVGVMGMDRDGPSAVYAAMLQAAKGGGVTAVQHNPPESLNPPTLKALNDPFPTL